MTVIWVAIGLILGGALMAYLSGSIKRPLLAMVVEWAGTVLVVAGLVLLLTPVVNWVNAQLRAMLNV